MRDLRLAVLGILLWVAWTALAAAQPLDSAERAFLQRNGERYRAAREAPGGLFLFPQSVADQLRAGKPVTLLDVRTREALAAGPVEGSRALPLADLLALGGRIDVREGTVVVVGGEGTEAIEAMVFLRLAGVPAFALSGSAEALQAELALRAPESSAEPPAVSPPPQTEAPEQEQARQPAPAEPPVAPPIPSRGVRDLLSPQVISALALLLVALTSVLVYFLVWLPRKRLRPLLEAFRILAEDREAELPTAAERLSAALTAGLKPGNVAEARFALAYVRARLGQLPEASAVLAEIPKAGRSREVLYLDLWLRAQQKKWDEIERLSEEGAGKLGDLLQTRLIAGIALLQQGRSCLAKGDTDRALAYFDRLRKLGVLADELPGDIEDHQVVLGIEALFDRDMAEARKRFTGALKAAERDGKPTLYAQLGILLCEWREADHPDVDARLGAVAAEMEKEVGVAGEPSTPLGERQRLLRDVTLWHAVSLLFTWHRLPSGSELPPARREELDARLARVRRIDPQMSDPLLLGGLIRYFFSAGDEERAGAVDLLEEAVRGEVHLPEVGLLVERERKLTEAAQRSLEIYLSLVKHYLAQEGVPLNLRQKLIERLQRFSRFKELGPVSLEPDDHETSHPAWDLHSRGELIHKRLQSLLKSRLKELAPEERRPIEGLLEKLQTSTRQLDETARGVESTENELMKVTGEFLFQEEERRGASGGRAA